MSNSNKVLIFDYKSLVRLKDALGVCGDSLLNLLHEVDNYLQRMLRQFEEQRDCLKERLEEAKDRLQKAEEAYSNCLNSQREVEDEDGHTYITPSCDWQRGSVETARKLVDECQRKVDAAERIISDCKYELEKYKQRYAVLGPNGGEYLIEYLADRRTNEAINKLEEILEVVVKEYLGRAVIEETNPSESMPSDKAQKFQKAVEKVKSKQKAEAERNNIAEPDVALVCQYCKRPKAICRCGRSENERGHTNFPQPNRVNQDVVGRIISDYNQNSR